MNNLKGFAFGILTSATFGLIPLFTLPLMAKGMQFDSILFYRFLFAALALAGIMAAKKESFHADKRDIPVLILLGFFYTASAMFLFWGYNFMSAGIATTLHFTYPVFVTLIMLLFFREKTSWITLMAIVLAICGVARKAGCPAHRSAAERTAHREPVRQRGGPCQTAHPAAGKPLCRRGPCGGETLHRASDSAGE